MRLRNRHRGMLGALAIAFGAAFAFGGHAGGEPKLEPVSAETLAVSPDLPAIPALALGETLPALAKPAAHPRRPKRHRAGSATPPRPGRTEPHADPTPGSPAAASPAAPRPRRRSIPAPTRGGGDSGADSTDNGGIAPAVTPAPAQVTPAPVEPQPDEEADPEEEPPPEEEEAG